jgi:hypothetical protein
MNNKYDLDKYNQIIKKCGFDDIKSFEMYVFLECFLPIVQVYELALNYKNVDKEINEIIEKYNNKYNEHITKNGSFWLSSDDNYKLQSLVAKYLDFNTLNEYILKNPHKKCWRFDFLRGYIYTYSLENNKLEQKCDWDNVYNDTISVIGETKGRAFYFLKALTDLHYNNPNQKPYYGFSLKKIMGKIKEYTGSTRTIVGMDWTILKVYGVYFKTGSKNHPEHALPIECVPAIDKALEDYKNKNIQRV